MLKNRFPSLANMPITVDGNKGLRRAVRWMIACIYLHNALIQWEDGTFPEQEDLPAGIGPLAADQAGHAEAEIDGDDAGSVAIRNDLAHQMFHDEEI